MIDFEKIEREYNFCYPEIYKTLARDGMLDWKIELAHAENKKWHEEIYPKLKKNPPFLLFPCDICGLDFEIISYESLTDELKDYGADWGFNKDLKLVPFGTTTAGDWWAFCFKFQNNGDIPIVYAPHDYEKAEIIAKNFYDFIFRALLQIVMEIDIDSERDSETEYRNALSLILSSHRPYIGEERYEYINSVYNRPINVFSMKNVFITIRV